MSEKEEVSRHNHMTRDMGHPNCPACAKYDLKYGEEGKHVLNEAIRADREKLAGLVQGLPLNFSMGKQTYVLEEHVLALLEREVGE